MKVRNDMLRDASGKVDLSGRLVGFLYDLMRDHVPPGKVESLLRQQMGPWKNVKYSNGWLAKYANDVATELLRVNAVNEEVEYIKD